MKSKWLASPFLFWLALFIVIPMFLVLYYAVTIPVGDGAVQFSLENLYTAITPNYIKVIWRSLQLAAVSTVICFVLGYPVAYILAQRGRAKRGNLLFLFAVPMWMNFLLRTYAWLTLLETNGVINNILAFLGFPRVTMLYTDGAVLLGMVYNFLPFMILPIYTVLTKIDKSLLEAAQDLGANPARVFRRVVFPLSVPGIISGVTMVFMPAVTTFIVSTLLGGGQYKLIGNLIEDQFMMYYNWNMGSAVSLILMALILLSMGIFAAVDRGKEVV